MCIFDIDQQQQDIDAKIKSIEADILSQKKKIGSQIKWQIEQRMIQDKLKAQSKQLMASKTQQTIQIVRLRANIQQLEKNHQDTLEYLKQIQQDEQSQ